MGSTTFTDLDDPRFTLLFTTFTRSAFRLETLQAYAVDYETPLLAAFLAGRPLPADPGAPAWTATIRAHVAAGRTFRRVHVITEPPSDYIRFELLHGYTAGVAGGEDIRIVPAHTPAAEALPAEDFWLFDDQVAVAMTYGPAGKFISAELVDDPAAVAVRRLTARAAWAAGVPLAVYLASSGLAT